MGMVGLEEESWALVEKRLGRGSNFAKQFCSHPGSLLCEKTREGAVCPCELCLFRDAII